MRTGSEAISDTPLATLVQRQVAFVAELKNQGICLGRDIFNGKTRGRTLSAKSGALLAGRYGFTVPDVVGEADSQVVQNCKRSVDRFPGASVQEQANGQGGNYLYFGAESHKCGIICLRTRVTPVMD